MTGVETCPASINNQEDLDVSTCEMRAALPPDFASDVDGVLIACFSVHPLVPWVSSSQRDTRRRKRDGTGKASAELCVTGIFEASIVTALSLLPPLEAVHPGERRPPSAKWGIVTTGIFWRDHLTDGVRAFLGQPALPSNAGAVIAGKGNSDYTAMSRFAGVFCSGADAGDFHPGEHAAHGEEGGTHSTDHHHHVADHTSNPDPTPLEKLGRATRELLRSDPNVRVVVLGCAGMAGFEQTVRDACIEVYGEDDGKDVLVVDGVRAGVSVLDMMIRSRRLFEA